MSHEAASSFSRTTFSTRAILESAYSGGEMPIEYMLRVMRNENAPDARRDLMARTAALYLHSRIKVPPGEQEEEIEEVRREWESEHGNGQSPANDTGEPST